MGLLKHLLFWPVTGPVALSEFAVRQVDGVLKQELTDDDLVKEDLMALQMELELGDIDEAEYEEREAALMGRLRETRAWRIEFGMEEEWRPLGYSAPSEGDEQPGGEAPSKGDERPGGGGPAEEDERAAGGEGDERDGPSHGT